MNHNINFSWGLQPAGLPCRFCTYQPPNCVSQFLILNLSLFLFTSINLNKFCFSGDYNKGDRTDNCKGLQRKPDSSETERGFGRQISGTLQPEITPVIYSMRKFCVTDMLFKSRKKFLVFPLLMFSQFTIFLFKFSVWVGSLFITLKALASYENFYFCGWILSSYYKLSSLISYFLEKFIMYKVSILLCLYYISLYYLYIPLLFFPLSGIVSMICPLSPFETFL